MIVLRSGLRYGKTSAMCKLAKEFGYAVLVRSEQECKIRYWGNLWLT